MKRIGLLLLVMILIAGASFARTREWKEAKVTDVSETIVSAAAWGDTNILHYTIETDDMIYVLDYSYNPAVKALWPGQHSKNRAPDVTVNAKTKIAIEGKDAYILDDTGREVKIAHYEEDKEVDLLVFGSLQQFNMDGFFRESLRRSARRQRLFAVGN